MMDVRPVEPTKEEREWFKKGREAERLRLIRFFLLDHCFDREFLHTAVEDYVEANAREDGKRKGRNAR